MVFGAILGIGASLIGARRQQKQRDKELEVQSPAALRASREAAGFNPLFNPAAGGVPSLGYAPQIGHNISTAGAIANQFFSDKKEHKLQTSRLELENRRLDQLIKRTILNSKVAGVYNRQTSVGRIGQANAYRKNSVVVSPNDIRPPVPDGGVSGGLTDLVEKPEIEPIKGTPLTSVVRTGAGGEPFVSLNPDMFDIGVNELAGGAIVHGAAAALNHGSRYIGKLKKRISVSGGGFNNPARRDMAEDARLRRLAKKNARILSGYTRGDRRFPQRKPFPFQ